jgi:predicted acyl esterase
MFSRRLTLLVIVLSAAVCIPAAAQTRNPKDTVDMGAIFERRDYMIPMRDGAKLYTEVYIPRDAKGPLPFLMERTPYDARSGLTGFRLTEKGYRTRLHDHTEMVRDRYIFGLQDGWEICGV